MSTDFDVVVVPIPPVVPVVGLPGVPGPQGPPGRDGVDGKDGTSVNIVGSVPTAANLPTNLTVADAGKGYITQNDGHLHVWDGDSWTDVGNIAGPAGPAGPQGPKGDTGLQGQQGPAGPIGVQGAQGIQGVKGDTGTTGPQGIQGVQGPKGDTGNTGATGAAGQSVSIKGSVGNSAALTSVSNPAIGDGWLTSDTGHLWIYQGPNPNNNISKWLDVGNITGPQGPQGPQGTQGVKGDTGNQGIQGIQGLTGATGSQGPKGDTGLQGPPGIDGAQGPAGSTGASGAPGVGVALGGTTGQSLVKVNNVDYATQWVTLDKTSVGLSNVDNTSDASKPVSTAAATQLAGKADKAIVLTTTAPLTGGGDLSIGRTLGVNQFGSAQAGVVPQSGGGTTNFLRADGSWAPPPGGVASTRQISTTAPLSGGGDLSADRTLSISSFAGGAAGAVPVSVGGTTNFLRADGQWAAPPGGGGGISGVQIKEDGANVVTAATGLNFGNGLDVTANANEAGVVLDLGEYSGASLPNAKVAGLGSLATKSSVANADMANMATLTLKGNNTGAGAAPVDLTVAQAKTMLALDNVNNTTDANKPVSTAQQTALNAKVDTSRLISTSAPLSGGGTLGSDLALAITIFGGIQAGAVPASAGGTVNFLRADGAWAAPPDSTTPADGAVTNVKLANMGASTIKGAVSAGAPVDLTAAQAKTILAITQGDVSGLTAALAALQPLDADLTTFAGLTATTDNVLQGVASAWASRTPAQLTATLPLATTSAKGLLPNWPNNTTTFLRGDGTYAALPAIAAGSVTPAMLASSDFGDFTVAAGVATVDAGAVTYAKIQNVSATSRFLGRVTAAAGVVEELTPANAVTIIASGSGGGTTNYLRADGTWAAPTVAGATPPYTAPTTTVAAILGLLEGTNNGTNRINLSGPANIAADRTVVFQDIAGTVYVSGGTDVPVADGGTGVSTLTGIVKGNGTSAFTAATAGTDYYNPGGTDVAVADGGTGRSTATTAYGLIAAGTTAAGAQQTISPGTSGQFLKSAGGSALASFASLAFTDIAGTLAQLNTAISDADVPAALNGLVGVWKGTAAQYAAIGSKDANTAYLVTA